MDQTFHGLRNRFIEWLETLESINLGNPVVMMVVVVVVVMVVMVMVSGSTTKYGLSKGKVYPCWVCSLRVKVDSVLCLIIGKWIHGKCVG